MTKARFLKVDLVDLVLENLSLRELTLHYHSFIFVYFYLLINFFDNDHLFFSCWHQKRLQNQKYSSSRYIFVPNKKIFCWEMRELCTDVCLK